MQKLSCSLGGKNVSYLSVVRHGVARITPAHVTWVLVAPLTMMGDVIEAAAEETDEILNLARR